jgi:UDP-N-acetyl-D-glucosamine dehydrogenase
MMSDSNQNAVTESDWSQRIEARSLSIGVVGIGYVGLPLALLFAEKGFRTVGIDSDEKRVERLMGGVSPVGTVPDERVQDAIESGNFTASADETDAGDLDAILICVPTPLTKQREPDLSIVQEATRRVGSVIKPGCLLVLESTTYPGTTRDVVAPILRGLGKEPGKDLFLAYSPEREDPNNAKFSTSTIPKLVGGMDEVSGRMAVELYEQVVGQVVPVSSAEVAEAAKLLENIFRSVNIALVNELKVVFDRMGIDIWEVVRGAATKPFGFMPFYPGPGLGGHCIPIDPFYLTWKAREFDISTKFIELAGEINTNMPYFVVSKLQEALGTQQKSLNGSRILILGLAYKNESPSLKLMEILERQGSEVVYHDPHIPHFEGDRHFPEVAPRAGEALTEETVAQADAVLLCTDHSSVDYDAVLRWARLIVDTRNVLPPTDPKVFAA